MKMPLLDSFCVNHKLMKAPAARLAKSMQTPKGELISVYDLRFCKPNEEMLPPKAMHTFEHLFAGFMREFLPCEVIDISPMGCRTGFYMSVVGEVGFETLRTAWLKSCEKILLVTKIPEANEFQCGSAAYHDLDGAKLVAQNILARGISQNDNEELRLSKEQIEALS